MAGFYDDPAIYDLLSTPGTAAEVDGLVRIARRYARTAAARRGGGLVWLEPACGTGRYLRVLAGRGEQVCGFDVQPGMVDYARMRLRRLGLGRRARVLEADMRRFVGQVGVGRYGVAFNLFNTIRHLESDAELSGHLREVARALRPGGIYAVGLSFTRYGEDPVEEDVWVARRGRCVVRQLVQYLPPGTWGVPGVRLGDGGGASTGVGRYERVVSHLSIERPAGTEHRDDTYLLHCYDAAQWKRIVSKSPLHVVATVDGYGRPLDERVAPYAIDVLMRGPRSS